MKVLSQPSRNTSDDYDICVAHAKSTASRQRLQDARPRVMELQANYCAGAWDFEKVENTNDLSAELLKDLKSTYALTYGNRALKNLRSQLLSVKDKLCPYCRIEEPLTLDHFLPKSSHEQFASFAPNLIPMCKTCNTLKGTKGSAHARQFFTHAYFDQLPHEDRFMVAQVAVGKRHIATNFVIDYSADLDAGVLQRLTYQFSVLRLASRYQLESINVIYEQAEKLDALAVNGVELDGRKNSILGDAADEEKYFGASFWRAALLTALGNSDQFCESGFMHAL
jgi:5-methylcytosine-specific restriction endonuclease McrA